MSTMPKLQLDLPKVSGFQSQDSITRQQACCSDKGEQSLWKAILQDWRRQGRSAGWLPASTLRILVCSAEATGRLQSVAFRFPRDLDSGP